MTSKDWVTTTTRRALRHLDEDDRRLAGLDAFAHVIGSARPVLARDGGRDLTMTMIPKEVLTHRRGVICYIECLVATVVAYAAARSRRMNLRSAVRPHARYFSTRSLQAVTSETLAE